MYDVAMSDGGREARAAAPNKAAAKREMREAVGWMLGPDLIGRLTKILGRRRDPRGWMPRLDGFVHDEHLYRDGRLERRGSLPSSTRAPGVAGVDAQRHAEGPESRNGPESAKGAEPTPASAPAEAQTVWFDYIADGGDASDAMYAIAVACLADIDADELPDAVPFGETRPLRLRTNPRDGAPAKLPRGQFLFIGGDTAYHVADEPTIKARVEEPFRWADEDLARIGAIAAPAASPPRLYGIPGNHDWYDNLDGYRVTFQRDALSAVEKPIKRQQRLAKGGHRLLHRAHLLLGRPAAALGNHEQGFKSYLRVQQASYVAIQLPHGWQLWGLDIDQPLDEAQKRYFVSLKQDREPTRLVLCTPSPPIAFGAVMPTQNHANALASLQLSPAYLDKGTKGAKSLPAGSLRLDISGDIHHYARYASDDAHAAGYAAVVSGLGGAFHHPSFTMLGQRAPQALYPTAERSRRIVGDRLLGLKALFMGSWIRMFPVLVTLILGFASTTDGLLGWLTGSLLGGRMESPACIPCPGLWQRFENAGLLLVVLVSTALLVIGAVKVFDITFDAQSENPALKQTFLAALRGRHPLAALDPFRGYWLSTCMIGAAIVIPIGMILWRPAKGTAWLDVATIAIFVLGLVGGPLAGVKVAAGHLTRGKLRFGVLGFANGLLQVVVPLFVVHLATSSVASDNHGPWRSVVVAVLACVLGWAMLPLGREPFRKRQLGLTVALALGYVLGSLLLLYAAGGKVLVHQLSLGAQVWRYGMGAIVAMLVSITNLTWYFAIAALMNGHNNEVGGAARVSSFRQIIRFRVDASGLTGYVIRIEDAPGLTPAKRGAPEQCLDFALVDVFSLKPRA
jgi:hypothetical protein